MQNRPKITVIMPVYNSESYMTKPISSILNQTLKEIELICVNDTSKDNSLKVLQKIRQEDNRLVILDNNKNLGPGGSRNRAILKARGEFIMFVDSDDWLESGACEKLYNTAILERADVVYIRPKLIFENKTTLDRRLFKKGEINNTEAIFIKNIRRKIAWAPWAKMIKRELLASNKIMFPEIHIAEDMVFSVKVLYFAKKIAECKEYLYNYLIRDGSLMSYKNSERRIENYLKSIEIVKEFLESKKIIKKYKKDFIHFKIYTYSAIYGVMQKTKEPLNKQKYKKIIKNDKDLTIYKILNLNAIDSVVIAGLLIKLNLFNSIFFFREKLFRLLKIARYS